MDLAVTSGLRSDSFATSAVDPTAGITEVRRLQVLLPLHKAEMCRGRLVIYTFHPGSRGWWPGKRRAPGHC
eukprot:7193642-Karenia_brevis.AAC.1